MLSCRDPHRTRCASPNRMLACVHTRMAPRINLLETGVLCEQRAISHAMIRAMGMGTASRLSHPSACLAYDVTKLLAVHEDSACHSGVYFRTLG